LGIATRQGPSRWPAAATPRTIETYGVEEGRISYISTGGGACLEFVEGKTAAGGRHLEEPLARLSALSHAETHQDRRHGEGRPPIARKCSREMLRVGVDVVRLNASHGTVARPKAGGCRW